MATDTSLQEDFARYFQNIRVYLDNASKALDAGEPQKAGEFLWGGMAATLKALAAYRGRSLHTHREIRDYAREMAKELDAGDVFSAFQIANSLHSNFYEAGLSVEDIVLAESGIRTTIQRLLALLPPETETTASSR